MAGKLVSENPPVPTDYSHSPCVWWNGNQTYTLSPGQKMNFPTGGKFFSPPVSGFGIVRNQIIFAFDINEGSVSAVIGVSNPSEDKNPMRPWVGVCYPQPTIQLQAGQRAHLHRVDFIDPADPPDNLMSWEMNPGEGGGSGRERYPTLAPYVTAGPQGATISNVQIEAFALQL